VAVGTTRTSPLSVRTSTGSTEIVAR
jgi:hypothetical protein